MKRIDIAKWNDIDRFQEHEGLEDIAAGINGIMDYLEAIRSGRPS